MGVLLMLMTIGGSLAAIVLFFVALYTGRKWLRNFVLGGVAVWFLFYFAMLVGFSLKSEEKELALNKPKAFCGFYFDCHMHIAVTGVRKAKTIGNKTAGGEFYVVTVNVSSDAVKARLGLTGVDTHVVDLFGGEYTRDIGAESELGPQPDFRTQIGPGESFTREIVFDLPADVQHPRLDIREGGGIDKLLETFLVRDEDSILHKRTYFKLEEQTQRTAVR
jgi:hypothetical protein